MDNKVVFITGASSGIGKATALAFAKKGWHIAGMARRAERLVELQTEISSLPTMDGKFLPIAGSVANRADIANAVSTIDSTFGRLDVLIANAGVGHRGALADSDWEGIESLLRTNIDGVIHSIQASVPLMRKSGRGHIFTVSSVAHNLVSPYAATYAASKAFVTSLSHSIRLELADENIWVTDVVIGRVETEFNESRLGLGARAASKIPEMSPEVIATKIVDSALKPKRSLYIRFMDRISVLGNQIVPDIIGRFVKKQYK